MLVKARTAASVVRPLGLGGDAADPASATAGALLADDGLMALREENEALRGALEEAAEAALEAAVRAREEGREAALKEVRLSEEDRLERLEQSLGQALRQWQERLAGLDALAALVARTALSKLFDGYDDHADTVARLVARQMARLRRDMVVAIHVSAADFAEEAALEALRARVGAGETRIVRDADLTAGRSRIALRLGEIELGLGEQWGRLAALLDAAMEEGSE